MRAQTYLRQAMERAVSSLDMALPEKTVIEPPKDKKFGDLACNAAMLLAKQAGKPPRELAGAIKDVLEQEAEIDSVEVAGPGFINVFLSPAFWRATVDDILAKGGGYGLSDLGAGKKVQVEFVSANPTGPLHIGHGRGAAVGDSIARVLRAAGYEVETEYYINDAGRQMNLLGASILARYYQFQGRDVPMVEDGYQGEYIKDHAREVIEEHDGRLLDMDEMEALAICREHGMKVILEGIQKDLQDFKVDHDVWFSERSLTEAGKVEETFALLKERDLAYEEDGALWFRSTAFGDDKDRVLRKSTGELTYFASDIAYHDDKYRRGFDLVIDVWGADHHGYVPRMKAAVEALGKERDQLHVVLVQLVNLLRGGEQVAMSTRAGTFETLGDVVDEVGVDAARFIFLSRKADSKLDVDLELLKQQSMDNPVYYVQYASARISSVFRKASDQGLDLPGAGGADLSRLDTEADMDLLRFLERYPGYVEAAARTFSAHHVATYLLELAGLLHRYYTVNKVLTPDDPDLTRSRLALLAAVRRVLANGLGLLGVEAPEKM
ncbi:arginine--tRNA ligase [Desulfohalovibrio reitneri]|uniref:arginine--tRNA ligase n=1 Tax=Desulfohalovibrio reitneri TaxID=1307759 RepID=UPI0004A74678|nr:arginine--tRNA ligase [Desulfohalovibrio reitneri]